MLRLKKNIETLILYIFFNSIINLSVYLHQFPVQKVLPQSELDSIVGLNPRTTVQQLDNLTFC